MRIVAFSGPKYSGKDTAAKALLSQNEKYGKFLFRRAPMAEGVKNVCKEMFGYTDELLEDPVLKETKTNFYPFIEPRWPMMDIANFLRDKYSGDIHARRWERVANMLDGYYACHVMPDLRFPEELEMLQRLDALIIYIWRNEAEEALKSKQGAGDAMALNPSEAHYKTIITNAHVVIPNDDTVSKLRGRVRAAVREKYGFWREWDASPILA